MAIKKADFKLLSGKKGSNKPDFRAYIKGLCYKDNTVKSTGQAFPDINVPGHTDIRGGEFVKTFFKGFKPYKDKKGVQRYFSVLFHGFILF